METETNQNHYGEERSLVFRESNNASYCLTIRYTASK